MKEKKPLPLAAKIACIAAAVAALCGVVWMIWVHRRVIAALIKGEPLPEPPEGCCHRFCHPNQA